MLGFLNVWWSSLGWYTDWIILYEIRLASQRTSMEYFDYCYQFNFYVLYIVDRDMISYSWIVHAS